MCLAKSNAAINKQRVVGAPRVLSDLVRRRPRQLIAFAFNEVCERKVWIQAATEYSWRLSAAVGSRHTGRVAGRIRGYPRTDFDGNRKPWFSGNRIYEFGNSISDVLVDPVHYESVGRQQSQNATVLDGLQRTNPRVELLLGQFNFQLSQTALPQRTLHGFAPTSFGKTRRLA
jgi:hypothetical protein